MTKPVMLQTIFITMTSIAAKGPWWDIIPNEMRLIFSLTLLLANLLVLIGVLYLAGLIVLGRKQTLLLNSVIISFLGTIISTALFLFIPYRLLAMFLSIFVWLLLIKSLYKVGWLGAIGIGIITMIVFLIITVLLALIFNILEVIMERFFSFTILTI